jgi:phosphohistidine phosphatase
VRYDERIYEATVTQLLEVIAQVDNDRTSVMLVGHNPGIEELLTVLTGEPVHVTTANLAKVEIKATKWSAGLANKGTLDWIIRPKEI